MPAEETPQCPLPPTIRTATGSTRTSLPKRPLPKRPLPPHPRSRQRPHLTMLPSRQSSRIYKARGPLAASRIVAGVADGVGRRANSPRARLQQARQPLLRRMTWRRATTGRIQPPRMPAFRMPAQQPGMRKSAIPQSVIWPAAIQPTARQSSALPQRLRYRKTASPAIDRIAGDVGGGGRRPVPRHQPPVVWVRRSRRPMSRQLIPQATALPRTSLPAMGMPSGRRSICGGRCAAGASCRVRRACKPGWRNARRPMPAMWLQAVPQRAIT